MRPTYYLLLLLGTAACQPTAEHQAAKPPAAAAPTPAASLARADPPGSGDAEKNGSNDTLHVGSGLVLRLVPGAEADFARLPVLTEDSTEAYYLREQSAGRVRRQGNTLRLSLDQGKALTLSNNTYQMRGDEDEAADTYYNYGGTLPGLPYWIVTEEPYENSYTWLIHQKTGRKTLVWTRPLLSPDHQHFVTYTPNLDEEMPQSQNGIQLFAVDQRGVRLLGQRLLTKWEPARGGWLDNHTLAVEQRRYLPSGGEQLSYIRLVLPGK